MQKLSSSNRKGTSTEEGMLGNGLQPVMRRIRPLLVYKPCRRKLYNNLQRDHEPEINKSRVPTTR